MSELIDKSGSNENQAALAEAIRIFEQTKASLPPVARGDQRIFDRKAIEEIVDFQRQFANKWADQPPKASFFNPGDLDRYLGTKPKVSLGEKIVSYLTKQGPSYDFLRRKKLTDTIKYDLTSSGGGLVSDGMPPLDRAFVEFRNKTNYKEWVNGSSTPENWLIGVASQRGPLKFTVIHIQTVGIHEVRFTREDPSKGSKESVTFRNKVAYHSQEYLGELTPDLSIDFGNNYSFMPNISHRDDFPKTSMYLARMIWDQITKSDGLRVLKEEIPSDDQRFYGYLRT